MTDISKCKNFNELPVNAISYLKRIEDLVGVPIGWVGVGPDRNDMIEFPNCNYRGKIMMAGNVLAVDSSSGILKEKILVTKVDQEQNGEVNLSFL